jgi:uncharacterized protein YndB with AHSA1/START domain
VTADPVGLSDPDHSLTVAARKNRFEGAGAFVSREIGPPSENPLNNNAQSDGCILVPPLVNMQLEGCMNTDRIEKKVLLRAPRERVWRAISDSTDFGTWFGVKFDGPFVAGASLRGVTVPTKVDPEVAKAQKPYEGKAFEMTVEQIEPERLLSFRWHPYAIEPGVDYSAEPTTLIVFSLEEADGGVLLTVTETGFDQIPLARRAKAFTANERGWEKQMQLIEAYLAGAAQV